MEYRPYFELRVSYNPAMDKSLKNAPFEELSYKSTESIIKFNECIQKLEENISKYHSIVQQVGISGGFIDSLLNGNKKEQAVELANQNIERSKACLELCNEKIQQLQLFKDAYARLLQYLEKVFIHWQFFTDTSILGDGIDLKALEQIQFFAQVMKTANDILNIIGFLVIIVSGGTLTEVVAAAMLFAGLLGDLASAIFNSSQLSDLIDNLRKNYTAVSNLNNKLLEENEIDKFNKKMQLLLYQGRYIQNTGIPEKDMWEALIKATSELEVYSGMLEVFYNFTAGVTDPQMIKNNAATAAKVSPDGQREKMTKMLFFNYYRQSNTPVKDIAARGAEVGLPFTQSEIDQILASDAIREGEDHVTVQERYSLNDTQISLICRMVLK